MLENEVEVEDPFELMWYENKRQENDAQALYAAAKGDMLEDVRTRCTMEGADVNRRTIDVRCDLWVVGVTVLCSLTGRCCCRVKPHCMLLRQRDTLTCFVSCSTTELTQTSPMIMEWAHFTTLPNVAGLTSCDT